MYFNAKQCEAMAYVRETNSEDGGDDGEANDNGGDGHVESIPSQAPGPAVVPGIVTVSGLEPTA